jgi:chitin synthase
MYMYYFLGHRLMANNEIPLKRKQIKAENTFLLALDGDIDFEPSALLLLVDLMHRDLRVGAACGRIHPTGSGKLTDHFVAQMRAPKRY